MLSSISLERILFIPYSQSGGHIENRECRSCEDSDSSYLGSTLNSQIPSPKEPGTVPSNMYKIPVCLCLCVVYVCMHIRAQTHPRLRMCVCSLISLLRSLPEWLKHCLREACLERPSLSLSLSAPDFTFLCLAFHLLLGLFAFCAILL